MKTAHRQLQLVYFVTLLFMIMACEHTMEPAFEADDPLLLEVTFAEGEQLYDAGGATNLELAIEKFRFVMDHDSENCFADAYFYLANIYRTQGDSSQARELLIQGKERYLEIQDQDCISDIIEQFDAYLENRSPDSLATPPIFVVYDEPPMPIGGFAEIQRNLVYPEDALDTKMEDRVIVQVFVDCSGHACRTRVIRSGQLPSMDTAARKAIKSVAWTPALLRNKPVAVWIYIPVVFRISTDD